jgi:hypothetical protein
MSGSCSVEQPKADEASPAKEAFTEEQDLPALKDRNP